MARNLDEFAAELSQVTAEATRAALTKGQANAIVSAAASGGEDAVRRLAQDMSTEDIQRVVNRLQR